MPPSPPPPPLGGPGAARASQCFKEDMQSVKSEFGQSGETRLEHSKQGGGFGVRVRNQPITEPFPEEELLTEEEESPVPSDEILTPEDHSLKLQEPPREDMTSESGPHENSEDKSRMPLNPQAVPMEGELCVTESQHCPWTAFTIKLRIQGAPIEAVVDTGAEVSVLGRKFYDNLESKPPIKRQVTLLQAGNEAHLQKFVAGPFDLGVGQHTHQVDLYVAPLKDRMLLVVISSHRL